MRFRLGDRGDQPMDWTHGRRNGGRGILEIRFLKKAYYKEKETRFWEKKKTFYNLNFTPSTRLKPLKCLS